MPLTLAATAGWLPLLLLGCALFLLPGLALRGLLALWAGAHDPRLGAPDGALGALLDGLGLSLAAWPLLLLYAGLLGIPVTTLTATAVLAGAALILLALAFRAWRSGSRPAAWRPLLAVVAPLALLTGLTLVLRFLAVRGLAVPNWGDSFHHTLITQLFIEQRGVPHGYTPYAPVYSFTYHFGFHGLAALWAWLTGQPAWSAVLTVGQVLNALAVPAAYVLTRELFRSRLAALGSAVVVGFLSGMPAQYVDWGRYTQLAGQVVLPFALVWFIRWIELPRAVGWGRAALPRLALAGAGAAGLGLTHYRVLIMYALFVIAFLAVRVVALVLARRAPWSERRGLLGTLLGRVGAVGGLGGLLFAPWLGNLLANYLPGLFRRLGQVTVNYLNDYTPDAFLTQYVGQALPWLAALGVLLVLAAGPRRARQMTAVLLAWTALLALSARPDVLHLPGVGAIGTFTIGIMLYLPLGTLAGPGIGRLVVFVLSRVRLLGRRRRGAVRGVAPGARAHGVRTAGLRLVPSAVFVVAALVLAAANPPALLPDPGYSYVTPGDLQALQWVAAHTPAESRFLISAQSTYQGRAVTAADAGMWLPLLTGQGRQTSVPPLSAGAEGAQAADLAQRTTALYTAGLTPTLASNVATLQRSGIGYVFLGEHTPTISPTLLLRDRADYCLLYRQGQSYVFGLRAASGRPCGP